MQTSTSQVLTAIRGKVATVLDYTALYYTSLLYHAASGKAPQFFFNMRGYLIYFSNLKLKNM